MAVTSIISLMVLMSSGSSSENCWLSTKTSNLSWVVSIRKNINPNPNKIICIGLIINHNEIVIPSKCLTRKNYDDYFTGTDLKAMTGVEKGSCRQMKDSVNYRSLIFIGSSGRVFTPNLLRYVATLEVKPFDIEKGYNPSDALRKLLPGTEESLRKYVGQLRARGVMCEVPIFEPDDGQANRAKLEQLRPIERKECEEALCQDNSKIRLGKNTVSCLSLLWSPDTYSCLSFVDPKKTCAEFNMGSPIICENQVCGILKECEDNGIVIMQILTVEHLDALAVIFAPKSAASECFTDACLITISFTTIFTSFVHRWIQNKQIF